ncbi:MAG TPA: ATPase, T2SS/T4P/T4SS family [Actinomycetota bacterium]
MASPLPSSSSRKTKKLGEILVEEGLITAEQLERALLEQSRTDQLLGRILIDLKMVKESDLMAALAKQIGFRFVDLNDYTIDGSAAGLIPEQVARRYRALPIGYEDSRLLVAMADPANLFALDDIRTITGMDLQPVVATAADIESAIRKYSRMDESVQKMASEASTAAEDEIADLERAAASLEEGPIVKMVNLLISQAIADRASDIHIEPMEREVRIRYRIDGVLSEVMRSPKNIQAGLISRLKVMADINIAERRVPQDGRIGLTVGGKSIDLRLATLPTVYGEKVVIRILDKSSVLLKLEELGFLDQSFKRYQEAYTKPYGAILVIGPTGSGKSTTLYATLNIVNKADRNIITVEDPVEYRLPGVNQMQMNVRAGLTFASALRSILRADPDVVLVGEIRDHETALIAIEAALTGHLVLSTLHTNDAPSSLPRLVEMGVETYLVASAIDCVVAQRLARKLCPKCREGYRPNQSELEQAGFPEFMWDDVKELFRPVGCTACSKTGFRGRLGMYEVMNMSEEIERLVVERAPSEEIRRSARRDGMITLREDGLEKVRLGITSVQEVLRVVS